MRIKTSIVASLFVSILLLFSFQNENRTAIEKVTVNYIQRYNELKASIADLKGKINTGSFSKAHLKIIKADYLKLRNSFKKWEYLGEYMDPFFVKEYLNGAPLQKIEANSFGPNIIEPKGLQAIDEVLYSDEAMHSKAYFQRKLDEMTRALNDHTLIKIYDRDVFIAARQGLVRLYTLGLTGFDTPGSQNGLTDTKIVIEAMFEDIQLYLTLLKNQDLAKRTKYLFFDALNYLNTNNKFDSFDRLYFLAEFVNPLYKSLFQIHTELGLEMPNEIRSSPDPVNYNATNIFDSDFLIADYYTRVPKEFNTIKTIELGKMIFFDPLLSKNNQRSCAGCHQPDKAFTDQLATSVRYGNEGFIKRNSPTLINSVYAEKFFHDLRAKSFEDQTEHVITSPDEFNTSFSEILEKINSSKQYQNIFKSTFHYQDTNINLKYIQFALSAYVSSLQGLNSSFDKFVRGETNTISQSVKNGYNLFMGKAACGTCHYAPIFNGTVPPYFRESESEVLGVAQNPYVKKQVLDPDPGRGNSLLKERVDFYMNSFKTPTVRNVEFTFPYMHNGAYKTLEDVMDFYNKGGGKGQKIKVPTQTLGEDKLNLSKREITDLINFMKALSDTASLTSKPNKLPEFEIDQQLNSRKVGGIY